MEPKTEQFIEKCRKKCGDKFDYSHVVYTGSHNNVEIGCKKHGYFTLSATNFLQRGRCAKCEQEKRAADILFKEFIQKVKELYGDQYTYEKVCYKSCKDWVTITCKEHGDFEVTPDHFLQGRICPICRKERDRLIFENTFLKRVKEKYGEKYYYSKVHYINERMPIVLVCKTHNEPFEVIPYSIVHNNKDGKELCPLCLKEAKDKKILDEQERIRLSTQKKKDRIIKSFFERAEKIHKGKYDYSKALYINTTTKICVICPKHGEFFVTPNNHLKGKGCPRCIGKYKTTEEFIKEAKEKHGEFFDYSKVVYTKANAKVCIICPEHGEFWQSPNKHLGGRGCPICSQSHLERDMRNKLMEHNIKFIQNYNPHFLKRKSYDFYLEDYNVAIECQGLQHFSDKGWYAQPDNEENTVIKRDIDKYNESISNGITLYYFFPKEVSLKKILSDEKFETIYNTNNVFYSIDKLIERIVQNE